MREILIIVALPALFGCAYVFIAVLLSGRPRLPKRSRRELRFEVIVPAHDEAAGIGRTVLNLKGLDWPQDRFRVIVVADNCTDSTGATALRAGAEVLTRVDPERRGKGYALAYAFEESRKRGWADALVIIDADAEASKNLLEAFAARIELGEDAVQVHYGVLNPDASWRTRLMTIAKGAFHIVRSRGRERLGVSCGLRGNGWCVTPRLLERVPYRAFSLTEDLEYGIQLGLAGVRVAYADEAHSNADMVVGGRIARKQRQRWEVGRFQLVRTQTLPLLKAAIARRSAVCLDLALDLLVPPLSYVALNVFALIALAALASVWQPSLLPWLWVGVGCGLALVAYVLRGWRVSGVGLIGALDLARAPGYMLWKFFIVLRRHPSAEWVRTERERRAVPRIVEK